MLRHKYTKTIGKQYSETKTLKKTVGKLTFRYKSIENPKDNSYVETKTYKNNRTTNILKQKH